MFNNYIHIFYFATTHLYELCPSNVVAALSANAKDRAEHLIITSETNDPWRLQRDIPRDRAASIQW